MLLPASPCSADTINGIQCWKKSSYLPFSNGQTVLLPGHRYTNPNPNPNPNMP